MSLDLECPKCRGTRWVPIRPLFAYRRNWRGRWVKVRVLEVVGCDRCKRVYELAESGALAMIETAPPENPGRKDEDEKVEDDRPRHALRDAIRRVDVGLMEE